MRMSDLLKRLLSFSTALLMVLTMVIHFPESKVEALTMTYTPSDSYKNSKYYDQLCAVELTDDQISNLINIAKSQEGYHEGSSENDLSGSSTGSGNYTEYARLPNSKFSNAKAWCAMFISWCARQAGIPTSVIKNNAWAGSMGASPGTGNFGGKYYPKGSITPKEGDIVYYGWGSSTSVHVEIVIGTTSNNIISIGGNTGGEVKVYRHEYSFTSSQIVGYERPNYSSDYIPPSNDDELGIPYPRPSGTPYLKIGSTGSYVSWLQTALNNLMNAGISVDGQFGTGTKNAVIKFQEQYGLEADGVVGPSTINKLVECLKNKLTPIPAAPVAVVDNVSPGTATFSWNAVEGATSYKITFRKSGDEYAVEAENYTGTSWTKTGLQPNTKYWFRVYAVNGSGSSPHSESISATTEAALDVGSDFTAMILNVNSKYLLTDEDYNAFFTGPTDTINQFWYFSRNSNGSYTIETPSRKFALDVSNAEAWDGNNVQLYEKNGTLAQQWFLCQAENGVYFKSALGNYALDMSGTSLGANAHLWQFNGTAAQIFDFYRIDLDGNNPVDLGDNFYAKIENTATGKMLANSGNNVTGADATDAKNQLWHFIRKSNGSYEIISYADERSMDVVNYGTTNGTNIGTMPQADNIAQRFFLYKIDGDIYIKAACSNNVFNMDLNTLNVAAWNYVNGVDPERFQIHKIESSVSKITIATPAEKTEYKVGESLDTTGLTLKVTYNTGDTKTVSSGFTAKYDLSEAGDKTVTITYDGKSTTYNVTVKYSAFIITFDAVDGVCEVANKKVKYESAYGVLPTAEKAGYTFDGWAMADGTVIDSTSIVMITENTTVYATYSNAAYIITFDAVYGTCDVESKKVKYGSDYGVLPDAEREGYIFHSWCLQDGTKISSTDVVTLTADTTVYALWEEEIIAGDVNADGTFTVADAVMLQKWLLNAGGINNWYAGDLCEDEVLNVFDLCLMKRKLIYG